MSQIAVQPIILTDVEFVVGEDDYAQHVSRVELVPTTPQTSWKGLSPSAAFNKTGRATWVANLDYAQDWTTVNSLARYLFDHQGETKSVTFKPQQGSGQPAWLVDVDIVAGPVGGAVDTVAVGSVSLPIQGQPVPDYDDDPLTPNPAEG